MQDAFGAAPVIVDYVKFCLAQRGEKDFVRVGDRHLDPVQFEDHLRFAHTGAFTDGLAGRPSTP